MHVHVDERRICKWHPKNSVVATFELLHEIGHIENNNSTMRRSEEEYYATIWAIDRLKEYGFDVPKKSLFIYQRYILSEISRGRRRRGKNYPEMNLYKYVGIDKTIEEFMEELDPKWRNYIEA